MVAALAPLHAEYGIKRLVISTYQSITGTGVKAVKQYEAEIKGKTLENEEMAYPHPIFGNCLPHCDVFLENDYTKEEMKLVHETRKILGDKKLKITATAVRVPVQGGHSEAVNASFKKAFEVKDIKRILRKAKGVTVQDNVKKNLYPMPRTAHNHDDVFVGRIRRDDSAKNALNLWIVSDNLRKGAATNAVQIAEYLMKKKFALELRPSESKVNVYTFPESLATEEFGKKMFDEWRNGQAVLFPEGYQTMERELSLTEPLLPDTIKVDRGDVIQRAQTEWQFVVLSEKLNQVYKSELAELKEKIEQLTDYDSKTWESLKTFWSKVQTQVRERNLFRDHANSLRENTNELFSKMKEMRAVLNKEFEAVSQTHFETFKTKLTDIEEKVNKGMNLSNLFNELKGVQKEFRDTKFTKEHRAKVWNKLDGLFKVVKEKKFGPEAAGGNSPTDRLTKRYEGLMSAIGRMENSIGRDRNDLKYEDRKIANSEGQLEAQIRQAKIKMIEERIRSKEEKLADMHRTREELEKKKAAQKIKDEKRAEQDKIKAAKEAAKAKIKEEMKAAESAREAQGEKLEKAADAIKGKKQELETKAEEILEVVTESANEVSDHIMEAFEDAVDTVKAIAEVIGGKVNEKMQEVKEVVQETVEAKKSL